MRSKYKISLEIETDSHAMAFASEGFDPSKQSYAFSFNIQKIANCVMVGVGNDEGIKVIYYNFCNWLTLGHG